MIGLYDSGLGGIATLNYLMKKYPNNSFICLADQANAPYGSKSYDDLLRITRNNLRWFEAKGVKTLVIACNTICSSVFWQLAEEFPKMKLVNIIESACLYLHHESLDKMVLIATEVCIKSGIYQRNIQGSFPQATLYALPTPKLVPLIENGADQKEIDACVSDYLKQYQGKVNSIFLGCTHYPLIKDSILKVLPGIECFDPNPSIRLKDEGNSNREIIIYTSNDPKLAQQQIKTLFDLEMQVFKK